MDRTYSMEEMRNALEIWSESLKGRSHMGGLDVYADGMIILKCV
jgi:hypothetical protein